MSAFTLRSSGSVHVPAEAFLGRSTHWSVQRTHLLFLTLIMYLLSQAYTIPVVRFGPSWAVWPGLPDFTTAMLAAMWFITCPSFVTLPRPSRIALNGVFCLLGLCGLSFLILTILVPHLTESMSHSSTKGLQWGLYTLLRIVQGAIVFAVVSCIPFTRLRLNILNGVVTLILLFVNTMVVLTYAGIIQHAALAPQIPNDPFVSGPWWGYFSTTHEGLGTIGYNHGYVGIQMILLYALRLHLSRCRRTIFNGLLLLFTIACIYMTGSRGALISILLFTLFYFKEYAKSLGGLFALVVLLGVAALGGAYAVDLAKTNEELFERNKTITEFYKKENLSGRDRIWASRLEFMADQPWTCVWGSGLGASLGEGPKAHNQYLQILVETGAIGFLVFLYMIFSVMRMLRAVEFEGHAIYLVTGVFMFSGLAKETLFPAPGHAFFIAFYMCAVAIALRSRIDYEADLHRQYASNLIIRSHIPALPTNPRPAPGAVSAL